MEFRISFCTLLQQISLALGWPPPVYSQVEVPLNYTVVVLPRGGSPLSFYFVGEHSVVSSEFADYAAEEAVRYLVKKKYINVDDVNLEKTIQYMSLSTLYCTKRRELETIRKNGPTVKFSNKYRGIGYVPVGHHKIVSIDFWDLWVKVSVVFEISFHDIETIIQPDLSYVCFFSVVCFNSGSKGNCFISTACVTIHEAKQELSKSVLKYYQPLYGFVVIDANYNKMVYTKFISSVHEGQYVLAKKRKLSLANADEYNEDDYHTLSRLAKISNNSLTGSSSLQVNIDRPVDQLITIGSLTLIFDCQVAYKAFAFLASTLSTLS